MRAGTLTETTAGLPEPSAEPTLSCENSLRGTDSLLALAWLDAGLSRAAGRPASPLPAAGEAGPQEEDLLARLPAQPGGFSRVFFSPN